MKLKHILCFLGLCLLNTLSAQELNATIDINYSQLQGSTNKQIFDQMKRSITEFMNNTKWAINNETYTQVEKIECSVLIIIKDNPSPDQYTGTMQVSVRRPIYKSSTFTEILNVEDETFSCVFQQFSQLEFNLNTFQNNLTSLLAYYAYVIIAADNDSFAPLGGTLYWQRAQQVVTTAQTSSENGWKSTESGQKNRYWLVENTLQPLFKGIRDCMYEYCRNGLDKMYENPDDARASILKSLELLIPVYNSRPASYPMQVFFNSKRDELINIFKGGTPEEKTKAREILMKVDPSGTTKYDKI